MSLTEDTSTTSVDSIDQGVTAADTPAAENSGEMTLVDAVMNALDGTEDSPTPDEPGAKADKTDEDAPGDASKDDTSDEEPEDPSALSDEEMAKLPARTQARISTLLDQRRALSSELKASKEEFERAKPAIENYGKIQSFMREHDLSPRDAGEAMTLAGLIQTNPVEAFKRLQPVYMQLAQIAGAVLPNDLAEDVRLGRITQERARELSAARAADAVHKQQAGRHQAKEQEDTQRRETEQHQEHVRTMARAGDDLSAEKAKSDPDWKLKEPLMVTALQADLARNGMPKSAADLRQRFDAAYKEVTKQVSAFRPAPKATQRAAPSASSAAQSTAAPPKSVQEAVLRALD